MCVKREVQSAPHRVPETTAKALVRIRGSIGIVPTWTLERHGPFRGLQEPCACRRIVYGVSQSGRAALKAARPSMVTALPKV